MRFGMNEQHLSDACKNAAIYLAEEAEDRLSSAEEHEFSKSFERKMKKLCGKMRGGKYHRLSLKARNLLIAAVITALLIGGVFAGPDRGKHDNGMCVQFESNMSKLHFSKVLRKYDPLDFVFEFSYVPKGFEKKKIVCYDACMAVFYCNAEGDSIVVSSGMSGGSIRFNSEDAKRLEMININGNAGVISEMEKSTLLYWAENGIEYHMHFVDIKGSIDPPCGDELIKMAESLVAG